MIFEIGSHSARTDTIKGSEEISVYSLICFTGCRPSYMLLSALSYIISQKRELVYPIIF